MQLHAFFQPHRLVTRHRNGAGASIAAGEKILRQRGQGTVSHTAGQRNIRIFNSGGNGCQQAGRAAGEVSVDAVRLRSREAVAAALHGAAVRDIEPGTEFGILCVKRTGDIHTAQHRGTCQFSRTAGKDTEVIGCIKRGIRHLQMSISGYRHRAYI